MGFIVRTELAGKKFLEEYPQTKELLQKKKCLQFIEKINGFHRDVKKTFARSFDGNEAEIGDIKITITESMITEATKLPRNGEKWFKNRGINGEDRKVFLKNPNMDTTIFRKGISSTALKSKWRNVLLILQNFVTCEGQFLYMYFYHIRMMMHFLEDHQMNLPYFLLYSLKKMVTNVQKRIQFRENTMHHHGLIKILVEFHLRSIEDNWESFLVMNHFEERSPEQASNNRTLIRRKRTMEVVKEKET